MVRFSIDWMETQINLSDSLRMSMVEMDIGVDLTEVHCQRNQAELQKPAQVTLLIVQFHVD